MNNAVYIYLRYQTKIWWIYVEEMEEMEESSRSNNVHERYTGGSVGRGNIVRSIQRGVIVHHIASGHVQLWRCVLGRHAKPQIPTHTFDASKWGLDK